jgi:hypothetical protein
MYNSPDSQNDQKEIYNRPEVDKVLRRLSEQESFYFHKAEGMPIGEKANSLEDFAKKIEEIDSSSLAFHFFRGDFKRWIKDTIGDSTLAYNLDGKDGTTLQGESLRKFILQQLDSQLKELKNKTNCQKNINTCNEPAVSKKSYETGNSRISLAQNEEKMNEPEITGKANKDTQCIVCGQKFDTKEQYQSHYKKSHSENKYKTLEKIAVPEIKKAQSKLRSNGTDTAKKKT